MNKPTLPGSSASRTGRTYWASFQHLANTPEIAELVEKEFPGYDPQEMVAGDVSRRRFMKYAAASMALAGVGLAGCRRWPRETVVPYAHDVKGRIPGTYDYYATSWELAGVGTGLLVSSYDGRPIKLEGNPQHPANVTRTGRREGADPLHVWGATDAITQAQTLSLYDPDRSRGVLDFRGGARSSQSVDWFRREVVPELRAANPARMAVLAEATASPTVLRLRQQFEQAFQGSRWYTWEPLGSSALAEATQAAAGQRLRPVYHLDRASVVVSIDDDYLGCHPSSVRYSADWAAQRAAVDEAHPHMSRCHIAECRYSLTGGASDFRLPVRPAKLAAIASGLAAALGVSGASAGELDEREREFVERAAHDLQEAGANGLVAWGAHLPAGLQVLCMRINEALANVGTTLTYVPDPVPEAGTLEDLCRRMDAGEIDTLLILGGNPVYNAPTDLRFSEKLTKVATSVHLAHYLDETGLRCSLHVPRAHFLEAWGDTRGWDGTVAPVQPMILPLFNGLSFIDLLAAMLGLEQDAYTLVRETLLGLAQSTEGATDIERFNEILHAGVVAGTEAQPVQVSVAAGGNLPTTLPAAGGEGQFDIVFSGDSRLYDGRFANNGWLMEMPDSLTKLTWDNAALMNIDDAERLGVTTFDIISLRVDGIQQPLRIAVYVMPGQPQGVIGLPLGFGRTAAGNIGTVNPDEPLDGGGFNTYHLRTTQGLWFAPAQVSRDQGRYLLAMTQNHHLIDKVGYEGRQARTGDKGGTSTIVHETTLQEHLAFLENQHEGGGHDDHGGHGNAHPAHAAAHAPVSLQIFNPPSEFNHPHAWGMTIDMNACTGCGACVMACVSENNIPVVGKEQVLNNREMHWLRVDRYFKAEGDDYETQIHDEDPDVVFQPMMCVHCENAPCEQVCPVAATVHDTEGLNVMIYNRCIGTRYCSNNCPYKVRKFNYLDWWAKDPREPTYDATFFGPPDQQQQGIDAIRQMVFNPEVTVRMRGVMEKCTYCVQRIRLKTNWRRNRGEEIVDGDIKTACQMACPTEAIIFGNLRDENARVTQQQKLPRAYGVLEELNTRPRTKYLARLRNREPSGQPAAAH